MTKKLCVVFTLLLAVSLSALAADINGKWNAQVPGRNGTRDTTFSLKANGDKLTGAMLVEGQETPIADGKASGDTLTFSVKVDRGGNMITYNFTGKISGDEIQFKREGGQGTAREFTAKRAK